MPRTNARDVLMAGVAAREQYARQLARLEAFVRETPSDYTTRGAMILLSRGILDEARLTIPILADMGADARAKEWQ